jgi:hypothetical protein
MGVGGGYEIPNIPENKRGAVLLLNGIKIGENAQLGDGATSSQT